MNQIYLQVVLIVFISHLYAVPCFSQHNSQTKPFRLLHYGEPSPDPNEGRILEFVGKRWGIEFFRVAGCNVSKELVDSVKQHNDKVESLIARKYGKDWNTKFDEELKMETDNGELVTALIDDTDFIKEWKDKMQKDSTYIHYDLFPIPNSTKYNASIKGLNVMRKENKVYFNLVIDYRNNSVTLE